MPAVFPGTHWEESSPESQGLDPGRLWAAIEFLKTKSVLCKNGMRGNFG
jgi:hypothetical protein